jgi:hypothetical protein
MTRRKDPPGTPSTCRSCGAAVVWATMIPSGKANPLDATPTPGGNTFAWVVGDKLEAENAARKTERVQRAIERNQNRYTSHFATCPNAKEHRRG